MPTLSSLDTSIIEIATTGPPSMEIFLSFNFCSTNQDNKRVLKRTLLALCVIRFLFMFSDNNGYSAVHHLGNNGDLHLLNNERRLNDTKILFPLLVQRPRSDTNLLLPFPVWVHW